MDDPEEHFLWALRNMPSFAGSGVITHSGFLRTWSKHLWEAGFRHHPDKQQIKFQEAFRGPHHTYNNAARWVPMDAPAPEPVYLPDVSKLTIQEQHVLAYQLEQEGVIPKRKIPKHLAQELNDG